MAGENDNEGSNFDDLAPLGTDGAEVKQDAVLDNDSKLDKLLDEHLEDTKSDARAPLTLKKDPKEGEQQVPNKQGQGTNQDDRTQQRGQGDGRIAQTQQDARPPRNVGSLFRANGDGSIYDLQGRKVANPGLERRVFDRVSRYFNGMETEHAGLKQRLEAIDGANAAAKAAGLSIEESALGTRIMTAWKRSPIETLNFLLTQATNQGHDVSSIRQGGAAFDPAAVGELLEQKLAARFEALQPLIDQLNHSRETSELREQVNTEITAFFEEHPDAEQHRPILGALMQKMDVGDPRLAWAELRVEAAKNGWDLTKNLVPQAQASVARRGNGAPTRDGNSRTVPDMTGRGGGGNGGSRVEAGSRDAASKDDSWDDIVAGSLGFRP